MKLIELKVQEVTKTHYLFSISIETINIFGRKKIKVYDCQRGLNDIQSKFISNGKVVFLKWLYMDNSINAILSTKSQTYKIK